MKRLQSVGFTLALCAALGVFGQEQSDPGFGGGLTESENVRNEAKPVRNDVAQPADPIVTVRHFKIQKGKFPEFVDASRNGVWPYFEKIGARVIGMWLEIHPEVDGQSVGEDNPEFDEVILMTQYASFEHWRATRDTIAHGGNGPDWDACAAALAYRRSVTLETTVRFLKGETWKNPPYFMPGVDENYQQTR